MKLVWLLLVINMPLLLAACNSATEPISSKPVNNPLRVTATPERMMSNNPESTQVEEIALDVQ